MNIPVIDSIVKGVSSWATKREERKQAVVTARMKVKAAKDSFENTLQLTDAEWESFSIKGQDLTWKDEYITVIVTAPLVLILLGAVYGIYTGDMRILDGVKLGLAEMQEIGVDLGELMYIVVLAGVGLKAWRGSR